MAPWPLGVIPTPVLLRFKGSRGRSVESDVLTLQPTMNRAKTSVMKAV